VSLSATIQRLTPISPHKLARRVYQTATPARMALIASNAQTDSTGTQPHAQAALLDVLPVRMLTSA
jgi:hypothetical protein